MAYKTYPYFAYGSNSTFQLARRIPNPPINSFPASLKHYTRIFTSYSDKWKGPIASIHPKKNAITCGIIIYLTKTQLSQLDTYEIGYERIQLPVLNLETNAYEPCYTYIFTNPTQITKNPSPAYLNAIKLMLDESNPVKQTKKIIIKGLASVPIGKDKKLTTFNYSTQTFSPS